MHVDIYTTKDVSNPLNATPSCPKHTSYPKHTHACTRTHAHTRAHARTHANISTHIHSIVKVCRKGALQTKSEAFLKRCVFRFFLKEEGDGELLTFVGREFQILAA